MPRPRSVIKAKKPRERMTLTVAGEKRKKELARIVSDTLTQPARAAITLTPCQEKALALLRGNDNVFLTGAAGTGKSTLLRIFLEGKPSALFPVVASTGVSAILVGGRTFHSFFGLGILEGGVAGAVSRACQNKRVLARLRRARGIVIDEVSMLPGEVLRAAEHIARYAREIDAPWGGLQVIAVGDFAQLPPVAANGDDKDWAFLSNVWEETAFSPALLQTCVRTNEPEFLSVLNLVRQGIVNEEVADFLNAKIMPPSLLFEGTRLFPHRASAEAHNRERLAQLPGTPTIIDTVYAGQERFVTQLQRNCPIPDALHLKRNALVMIRKNDVRLRYVNGSLGRLKKITAETLTVELLSGEDVDIGKTVFELMDGNGAEVASAWNFPVNLAWASTIHKSQGATLDRIMVDLSRLWEPGQAYVALSRVRSSAGLCIECWNPSSIIADSSVMQYYQYLIEGDIPGSESAAV
jgi:hypothetical protein